MNSNNDANNNPKKLKNENIIVNKKNRVNVPKTIIFTFFKVIYKAFSYIINILLTVFLIGIITGGIVAGAFAIYIQNYIDPTIDDLTSMSTSIDKTTTIYYYKYEDRFAKTNPELCILDTLHGSENRFWVKYSSLPKSLIDAFLSIEDKRFFEHKGVDIYRSAAAVKNFFIPTDKTFGGSTITQQLVKMMTGDDDQRIQRKIQEMLRALYLEKKTSKEQILETYLNTIFLSNRCYGVQAAAKEFFDKDVSELTILESAALAAIVKEPFRYDPINKPEKNFERRNTVLYAMKINGKLSEEEYKANYDQPLVIKRPEKIADENIKSYYTDQVINDVRDDLMKKYNCTAEIASSMIYSGGLSIYTCMDYDVQRIMDYVYTRDEYFPAVAEGAIKYQSAMVVLDPTNNNLLGIEGGRGEKKENRGLIRASDSFRQPGSSIKPVAVYAPALERGIINYGTPIDDSPTLFNGSKGWPVNSPERYRGYAPICDAIEDSINTVATKVMQRLTPQYSFDFMYYKLNMTSLVEKEVLPNGKVKTDIDLAPMALGGLTRGLSVYELTAAYSIIANNGIYSKPRSYTKVLDSEQNIVLNNELKQSIVVSEETAAILTKMMQNVVKSGTAGSMTLPKKIPGLQVAGKTGTTSENKDKWFIGFTPYYLCGAWFGYDTPKYLGNIKNPAIVLFDYVMETLHRNIKDPKPFEVPSSVITAQFCMDSGMALGSYCALDPRGSRIRTGYFVKGSEPMTPCDVHVPVLWDKSTGSVAGPGCPSNSVITIALVRNDLRNFPVQVVVADAQYTYRDIDPATYVYPSSISVPFYQNIMPPNTVSGTSGAKRPVNSFCVEHNHNLTLPVTQRPTEPPVTTIPEITTITTEAPAEPQQTITTVTDIIRPEETITNEPVITDREITTNEAVITDQEITIAEEN